MSLQPASPSDEAPIPQGAPPVFRALLVDLTPGPIPRASPPVPTVQEATDACPGQRVIDQPPESTLYLDDAFLVDHAGRGTRQMDAADLVRGIFAGGPALPGLGLRGVTVPLNFQTGPVDNYAIAAHGLGSMALHVTLTKTGGVFLAPWLALDENRVEIHVTHDFSGPATATISALIP